MMKTKYYISVQAGSILEEQGAASYEFEIEATEDEISQLQEMFDDRMDAEDASFMRAPTPAIPYHYDRENDAYDYFNKKIYSMLYDLGTEETKKHIASMGILTQPSS